MAMANFHGSGVKGTKTDDFSALFDNAFNKKVLSLENTIHFPIKTKKDHDKRLKNKSLTAS
jgi:hypothetical protein